MKFNKKLSWEANVHIYGLSLAIGDAHFLIDKIKAGDAYTEYFYNIDGEREGEPEGEIDWDTPHGEGTMTYENGFKLTGKWENGSLDSQN